MRLVTLIATWIHLKLSLLNKAYPLVILLFITGKLATSSRGELKFVLLQGHLTTISKDKLEPMLALCATPNLLDNKELAMELEGTLLDESCVEGISQEKETMPAEAYLSGFYLLRSSLGSEPLERYPFHCLSHIRSLSQQL